MTFRILLYTSRWSG